METSTPLPLVKEITEQLLAHLQCPATVDCSTAPGSRGSITINVSIKTPESRRLIGQHGANLQALQHVVRLLVSSKTGRPSFARVDVNNYKSEREDKVVQLAREMAEKAIRTDNMVIMRPMTSFERRLVHVALQENKSVTTESLGQEPNRRIVVKPMHESRVVRSLQEKGFTLDDIKT
jgi:spoIIIJ-associated protein